MTYPGDPVVRDAADAAGTADLEPGNTHFLLPPVDDWGQETPFMFAAVRCLRQRAPAVAVVANGGGISRAEVLRAVLMGIPVVLLEGSGRLADTLADMVRGQQAAQRASLRPGSLFVGTHAHQPLAPPPHISVASPRATPTASSGKLRQPPGSAPASPGARSVMAVGGFDVELAADAMGDETTGPEATAGADDAQHGELSRAAVDNTAAAAALPDLAHGRVARMLSGDALSDQEHEEGEHLDNTSHWMSVVASTQHTTVTRRTTTKSAKEVFIEALAALSVGHRQSPATRSQRTQRTGAMRSVVRGSVHGNVYAGLLADAPAESASEEEDAEGVGADSLRSFSPARDAAGARGGGAAAAEGAEEWHVEDSPLLTQEEKVQLEYIVAHGKLHLHHITKPPGELRALLLQLLGHRGGA